MIKAIFGLAQTAETEQFVNSETSTPCLHYQTPISEAANNRIMQTPRESTNQSKMAEVLLSLPPLGLKLHKAPSFMDLIETKLFPEEIRPNTSTETNPKKASNADMLLLRIGSWQRVAQNKEELVAKCYFAKRKLMWEILENGLKRKIQMQWENILAIRADIKENQPGILEIELSQPPSFFHETEPQPKKHTLWDNTSDFTGGQAMICRRHFLQFPPGALDKLYEKLLKHEPRFSQMSQRPFPSLQSPYFDSDLYNLGSEISFGFNGNGLHVHSVQEPPYPIGFNNHVDWDISFDFQQMPNSNAEMPLRPIQVRPNQDYHTLCNQSSFPSCDFSPTSVMDVSQPVDELTSMESVSNMAHWGQCVDSYADTEERDAINDQFFRNNPHFLALTGNESRFSSYSGVEAEEMNSANYEYGSIVSENLDSRFYHQPISWIQAEDKLACTDFGQNQTMTQFFGIENSVCPWV